jgi:ATP-dependent helicase HrpB
LALLIHNEETALLAAISEMGDPSTKEFQDKFGSKVEKRIELLIQREKKELPQGLNTSLAREILKEKDKLLHRRGKTSLTAMEPQEIFPDRLALYMGDGIYQLSTGRQLKNNPGLNHEHPPWLLVLQGDQGHKSQGIIRLALSLDESQMKQYLEIYSTVEHLLIMQKDKLLRARQVRHLDSIELSEQPINLKVCKNWKNQLITLLESQSEDPLPQTSLRSRLNYLNKVLGAPWPSMDRQNLVAQLPEWLELYLPSKLKEDSWKNFPLNTALKGYIPWDLLPRLNELAPESFALPGGRQSKLQYLDDRVILKVQLQRLLGLQRHPMAAGKPLEIHLLSPAQRPLQITSDILGFWQGSYSEVRKEMAGRYPKHKWPVNPLLMFP